ncbi:MAG: serpin family protein [Acidobacteria bacterium]|nr:MAG: serpin family protein [Acidobacteriota bacterium]
MLRLLSQSVLVTLVVIAGLLAVTRGSGARQGNADQAANTRLAAAHNAFGFKLFSALRGEPGTENLFISPSSVAFALAMTWNGAAGPTRESMSRALELGGMDLDQVNQASLSLKTALGQADPTVELHIANSLWAKQGLEFKPDFMERNRQFFKAEVTELSFSDPGATARINNWVSQNTSGKIDKIIDRIDSNSILFLINAIYFKGKWTIKFQQEQTTQRPFTLASGTEKQVPMMRQAGEYQYVETPDFQAISLPYGNKRWNLRVFLPSANRNLSQFLESLTASNWDSWMRSFRKREGEILLPRFRVEYEKELNEALKALGMNDAFDQSRADFSAMIQSAERAFINQVKHRTFVEVNEEGTEAAASTSVGVSVTSYQEPTPPFRMEVNRPFFCAIRDDQSGALLFLGAIGNPK